MNDRDKIESGIEALIIDLFKGKIVKDPLIRKRVVVENNLQEAKRA